jgi:FtsP/CotA-like multicopper oxidase with cupredoxin domain
VRKEATSRRNFLKMAGTVAGAGLFGSRGSLGLATERAASGQAEGGAPDYSIHIAASAVEIAPKHIVSTNTYNGQFPGPLLRFKEGQPATIDLHNDTDAPEQLHWHGQMVLTDVDGAAEEGFTPFIPAHGMRRITFTPRPSGFRFYTRIIGRGPISTLDNTAARSGRFI